jgi:chromosome segregation ATPase
MTEQQLINLKSQIEDAKSSVSELKGQQTALLKQLKDTYKCSTIEEADKLVEMYRKDIASIQKDIEEHTKELEEKYNG